MSLFNELKRRNVFRVAAAYLVIGWLLVQVLGLAAGAFAAPPWVMKMFITLLAIGFIPTVLFSWAYELTPEGLKKDREVDKSISDTTGTAKKLDVVTLIGVLGVVGLFAYQQINPISRNINSDVPAIQADLKDSDSRLRENDGEVGGNDGGVEMPDSITKADDKSIAVLPFVDLSPANDQEYFTDGLTENLLHALAQIKEFKVVGRTSSFAYKNKNVDLREIGQTLNVQKILEGSVQKSGERIRITAQLINADDGIHVFSKTYDRDLVDIFAVQDEITAAVVMSLRKSMLGKSELSGGYKGNYEAYNAYLLALELHKKRSQEAYDQAIKQFQTALKIDPNMALAWAGLSKTYSEQTGFGTDFTEGYERARTAALKAISLAPDLPEAHLALAEVQRSHDWDWDGYEASLRRAYSLRPGDADIVSALADLKTLRGDFTGAMSDLEQALLQDPLNEKLKRERALLFVYMGRTSEALIFAQEYQQKYPERGVSHFLLASIYFELGDYDQALVVAKNEKFKFLRLQLEAIINEKLGNRTLANAKLEEMIETYGDDVSAQVASVYAAWGNADQFFAALDRGFEVRDPGLIYIQTRNWFTPFHDDPRYEAFLKKMGFK